MKVKIDFVTNSSSSSFLVVFEKRVKTFEDVEFLISRADKARQVLKDALAQKPKKINPKSIKLVDYIANELSYGYIDWIDRDDSKMKDIFCKREGITTSQLHNNLIWSKSFYDEERSLKEKAYTEKAAEFISLHEGKYLYLFHYGDDDGLFMSEMEHGFTFTRLPHITISKH